MDAAQALDELMRLSSQIEAAAVLGAEASVIASRPEGAGGALAATAVELIAAAREIGAHDDVTRVEVELADGAIFVVRENERTVVARTGPEPSAGLVVYDLRTCVRSIADEEPQKPKAKRTRRSKERDPEEAGE